MKSHRSGVALINLTEIMNSGWRRLAHWCFVKKMVLNPGRIDQMLVIISMRLKSGQDGRSSSSVHPVLDMTWMVCPVI